VKNITLAQEIKKFTFSELNNFFWNYAPDTL